MRDSWRTLEEAQKRVMELAIEKSEVEVATERERLRRARAEADQAEAARDYIRSISGGAEMLAGKRWKPRGNTGER